LHNTRAISARPHGGPCVDNLLRGCLVVGLHKASADNGPTLNGRPGTDQLSNHEDLSAGPVHSSGWLSSGRAAITDTDVRLNFQELIIEVQR
jgi:hypothetical protein